MQVTHNSNARLEIGVRPGPLVWILRLVVLLLFLLVYSLLRHQLWLLGGFVLATGLVFLYVAADLGRSIRIVFDRNQDLLIVKISGILGSKKTTHAISGLQHAEIRYGRANRGEYHQLGRPMRPVILTTDDTEIPLNDFYETGSDAVEIASIINSWLDGHESA